jgi:hypothetical protein
MANVSSLNNNAPGLNQPFVNVFQSPIVSRRAPTSNDKAPIGCVWVYAGVDQVYMATSIDAGATTWSSLSGGAGLFTSLTVSNNITSVVGNITASAGDIIATLGDIISSAGIVRAQLDVVAFTGEVIVGGDTGVVTAGKLGITNVTNTTQGAGALSLLSTTGNPGNNAGFIKIYLGGTTAWIPYFTNIAP